MQEISDTKEKTGDSDRLLVGALTALNILANQFHGSPQSGVRFMKGKIVIHWTVAQSYKGNLTHVSQKDSFLKFFFFNFVLVQGTNPGPTVLQGGCSSTRANQEASRSQTETELITRSTGIL